MAFDGFLEEIKLHILLWVFGLEIEQMLIRRGFTDFL